MNYRKYLNSAALKADPLCGIDTYKDILNLATGQTERKIKKLVLDGSENTWYKSGAYQGSFYLSGRTSDVVSLSYQAYCSHATFATYEQYTRSTFCFNGSPVNLNLWIGESSWTVNDFKTYLQQQYAAGTPVTIWYALATATTETISLPSGLSGTLEGSLTQSGTPTPSAPIYPTAVTGEGWYNINTYKRSVLVWNTDTAYERDSGAWS